MPYGKLRELLPGFTVEPVTLENLHRYEAIFCGNTDYCHITDGRPATKQDCIETIEMVAEFADGRGHSIGFSLNGEAVAFMSCLEGYPDAETAYIGLFLMDERYKRRHIGTQIVQAMLETARVSSFHAVRLSVQDNNISGCAFWRKLGFEAVASCDGEGFCNLSMKKTL